MKDESMTYDEAFRAADKLLEETKFPVVTVEQVVLLADRIIQHA